jgi:hypothetical protein
MSDDAGTARSAGQFAYDERYAYAGHMCVSRGSLYHPLHAYLESQDHGILWM